MTKDFLLRLTEEHYGAGAFPVYGRLLEEQRLTRGGPLRLATDAWTGAERNAVERGVWRLRTFLRSRRTCTSCCGSIRRTRDAEAD